MHQGAPRLFAFCVVLLLLAVQATAGEISLRDAVEAAIGQNLAYQAKRQESTTVRAGIREAFADAFPQLSLDYSYSESRNPALLNSPDFEDIIGQLPEGSFEPAVQELHDVALTLHQPLFTWGRLGTGVKLARLAAEATDASVETAKLDTALKAAEAFYGLLEALDAVEVADRQIAFRDEALKVVKARYRLGEATKLELLRAEADRGRIDPQRIRAKGNVELARSRLRRVMGRSPEALIRVARNLPPLEEPSPKELLLRAANRNRPELRQLDLTLDARSMQAKLTRKEGRPQISLNASYGRQVRLFDNFDDPLFDNWRASIDLTWSLFDGGRRRARMAKIRSQEDQIQLSIEDLKRSIETEIVARLVDYQTAVSEWKASRTVLDADREAARVALEAYRKGVAIQADLLDAEQREAESHLSEARTRYESHLAKARLKRSVGLLPMDAMPEQPPRKEENP